MKNFIDENTLAIISYEEGTKIISKNEESFVDISPKEVINNSCLYYGSSLIGRIEGTNNLIGIKYKSPIIVCETKEIIAFPTCSYKNKECNWIILNELDKYYINKENELNIVFKNGKKIKMYLTLGIFDKQVLRASRLLGVLNSRK